MMETHMRLENGWVVLPVPGEFAIVYKDVKDDVTTRHIHECELKIGLGRTLLVGRDEIREGNYRGFRADRMIALTDETTGETITHSITDYLFARAGIKRR
jgi:predicted DNA-binding transcriptional regulator YafY